MKIVETKDERAQTSESADEKLLREIREDYRYFLEYWRENREEAAIDMRFVSGDPWDPAARKERTDLMRPVICPDEIGQYLNQAINNLRQNKRAIKVLPKGSGASDQDAERRAALIRGFEYQSNAQAAYATAFEGAINCGVGFFRITSEYIADDSDEQQPRIKRIPNPMTVLMDPDAQEADFSDCEKVFVIDTIRKADFERKYPTAQKKSFSAEDAQLAPDWFKGNDIVIAEAWRVEYGAETTIGANRKRREKKVVQYITNGVEILEKKEWVGSWIPIIGAFGKEIYVTEGGRSKRIFESLVRKARQPQMMLAYIASQEAEEFSMAPRAPFVGAVGQFESDKDAWDVLNKVPRPYVQYDVVTDGVNSPLPPPSRPQFQPNAQAYEIAREAWRRAVQAAMGISPLPTAAQRQNEKSGVALERIQTQQQVGSFHFTDNFDRALENAGRQLNELITKIMDTPRHVAARNPDDTHSLMLVTPKQHESQAKGMLPPDQQEPDYLVTDRGEFDVTISTGPSFQSQREESSAFVDVLITNIQALPIAPPAKAALLSKAIKLKSLGPIGDEIAKILDPQGDGQPIPPQAQAALAQAQQQLQAMNAYAQQIEGELKKLQMEKQAKLADNEAKMAIEKMRIEAQVAVAEIQTKAQSLNERIAFVEDLAKQFHAQAHEQAMQAADQQHQATMADQQAAQQAQETAMQSAPAEGTAQPAQQP